jgi:hypothetical protein
LQQGVAVFFSKSSHMNISVLPVHVARPLFKLYATDVYFKRLHLISDILLGFFRLYGHAIITMSEKESMISEGNEQVIETLMEKDSHGLWSTTISKLLQEHAKNGSSNILNHGEYSINFSTYYVQVLLMCPWRELSISNVLA